LTLDSWVKILGIWTNVSAIIPFRKLAPILSQGRVGMANTKDTQTKNRAEGIVESLTFEGDTPPEA
jgi:hypothetical protein